MRLWRRGFKPIPLKEDTVVFHDDGGFVVTLTSGVELRVFADGWQEDAEVLTFVLFLVGQTGKSRRVLVLPKDSVAKKKSFMEEE